MTRRTKQTSVYNATVVELRDGKRFAIFVAQVDDEGFMLRSNAVQCTGYEGTRAYDEYYRRNHPENQLAITRDERAGYLMIVRGQSLPDTYYAVGFHTA